MSVVKKPDIRELAEAFMIEEEEELYSWTIPVLYKLLFREQQKDSELKYKYLEEKPNSNKYQIRSFSADANTA